MAADIQKHFKSLRVDTGRRRSRKDPFADPFEDDSDDDKRTSRSRSKTNKSPPSAAAEKKEKPPSALAAPPAKNNVSSLSHSAASRNSEDEFLDAPKRTTDRRPSPAPAELASLRVSDGAGRRGSLDHGLQSKGLAGRGVQTNKTPRSAVALAAGNLAYLDDSGSDDEPQRPSRADRHPSPAPRKQSDSVDPLQRSGTPTGAREPAKEPTQPSRHTVASPFAGTKYLEDSESDGDSDSDSEAVTSRSGSLEGPTAPEAPPTSPEKGKLEVKRVDKPKQHGGGVSWRAFSAGRAEQRSSEIEALQTSLKQRGKSISFGTHAVTDDGNRVPIPAAPGQIVAAPGARGRGRKGRGKSPPRRAEDTRPAEDEGGDGGAAGVGVYDPTQFKTNPFTGEPVRRTSSGRDGNTSTQQRGQRSPDSLSGSIPDIRINNIAHYTGSLSSKMTISPPQTIPEEQITDKLHSPLMSPTEEYTNPLSRNSSARSIRMTGSRATRIPGAGSRRQSRRSLSANPSPSPAHTFLSSWSRDAGASEPAPEPKPDDEGQAIGLNNEYIIGRTINQGGFGVVKEVHAISPSGEPILRAVKIVRKAIPDRDESENEKAQQELEHEVSIWRHLKHRHILDLHAVYETDFATFCMMELNVGGTLFDIVRKARMDASSHNGRKGLEPKLAKHYAYQLACALRYLHEDIRVCHRDVKLENCLIDLSAPNAAAEGGNLRLCDFGLADFLHNEGSLDGDGLAMRLSSPLLAEPPAHAQAHHRTQSSVIGTLEYASPRGLSVNRKLFETAGDMWAFGVIVYALVTGELPFRHAMPSKTVEMIMQAAWDGEALAQAYGGGKEVRELVQGCLERDVEARWGIGEVLGGAWFEGMSEEGGDRVNGEGGREDWR
ncbi:uncharacterized protein LTR77_007452 [Saxophila tyrrhenica]|uniref:Protein kinase domain-containing protein n=1 Tax=Saxophila tyrrhenica TaxID=1690608 RepID=A0AAV9P4S0_9PEZI|nr:hypothetical protein LTR77_007452 [Saxophila tyrrhenica]